jgi:hypothetical protein
MNPLRGLAIGAFAFCLTVSSAEALTPEEEQQLGDLLSQATSVSQGVEVAGARITAEDGVMLRGKDACTFSMLLNADEVCNTTAIVFPKDGAGIDSIYYAAPEDIGHVNMDDWREDVTSQIDDIWESYVEGSRLRVSGSASTSSPSSGSSIPP